MNSVSVNHMHSIHLASFVLAAPLNVYKVKLSQVRLQPPPLLYVVVNAVIKDSFLHLSGFFTLTAS